MGEGSTARPSEYEQAGPRESGTDGQEEASGPAGGTDRRAGRRGSQIWRDWYVAILAAGAAVFALGPSLVGARTLISVDSLSNYLPWRVPGNQALGHEMCQSDTIDSVMPAIAYTRRALYAGHLPNWQDLQSGGGPLGSLPNTGLLDPLSLPYWVLPLRWAPAFVILLCWLVSIGGTYLFLRRLSVGRPAATLAGFIFATSGFMVMWSNWPQTRTAALVPALFWATDRVATRSRPGDVALLGAVVASMLLGGFPAVTGYALYMAGGYFVVRVIVAHRGDWGRAGRVTLLAAGGMVLGGLLSAVQMLPFADFYRTHGFGYRGSYSAGGLPAGGLVTSFAPNANGLCILPHAQLGPTSPVELVAYVGAAALVLAVVGAAFSLYGRRPAQAGVRGYFAGAVLVITLVCWLSPSARSAASSLPVIAGNLIGRIRSVWGFGLAVLAGFGFDWVTTRRARPPRESGGDPVAAEVRPPARPAHPAHPARAVLWPLAVVLGVMAAAAAALRAAHRDAFVGHYVTQWEHAVWIPLALIAVSVVVVAATRLIGGGVRGVAFVVLPVLVVAQGTQFFHAVMPGDSPKLFYPTTADHRFLAEHLGQDRFASSGLPLYASTAFYYGLRSATGHQYTISQWNDLLQAVDPQALAASPTNTDLPSLDQNSIGHQPLLDRMAVRYFVLPPGEVGGAADPSPPVTGTVSTAGGPVGCTVAGGPLRGITFKLAQGLTPAGFGNGLVIHMTVTDGATTLASGNYSSSVLPAGQSVSIGVPGEDLPPGGTLSVRLSVTAATAPMVVAASSTQVACSAVRPRADGLRLVYADPGALIYQRLTALPRIRWASGAEVVTGPTSAQLAALAAAPPSTVVLSAPGPAATGAPATVAVTADRGDHIAATVDARRAGYLVVADAMQAPGWSVTVDGHPARLRAADHAMVAVAVPAGRHRIAFSYAAPGQVAGAALTGIGLAVAAGLIWADTRRRRGPLDPPPPSGGPAGRAGAI